MNQPAQPMKAAAWLKKVADGGRLKAINVGSATAAQARAMEAGGGVLSSAPDRSCSSEGLMA